MTQGNLVIVVKQSKSGDITIRIPRAYLRHAVTISEQLPEGSRVTNTKTFSDEIVRGLDRETEDGSNPIHLMLDDVILEAIENGAEGVSLGEDE